MMFNEYVNHSNQCSNYYGVVRKEEVQMQQADTSRFKQKWMDVNQSYPQQQQHQQQQVPMQTPQYHPKPQQYPSYADYSRQPNTPNQTYEFIPKTNERSITPTVQSQHHNQKQYYYANNMPNRNYYNTGGYDYGYEQTAAMSPVANKFSKKISSSSLNNASQVDFGQAPTPSSSSTSSVLSPQPHTKIESPKSWNTPVPTPLSVSQTTPPRNIHSSQPNQNEPLDKNDQSSKSILSEININIDELFMYYPAVFEEIYYSLKLSSIEQIENDLRRYLEEHFKLNLSGNSSSPVSAANIASAPSATNSAGIRI